MKHILGLATASLLTQVVFGKAQNPRTPLPTPPTTPGAPKAADASPAGFPDFPSHPGGFPTGKPGLPGAPPGLPGAPGGPSAPPRFPPTPPSAPTSKGPPPPLPPLPPAGPPPSSPSQAPPKGPGESDSIPASQCPPGPNTGKGTWSPLVAAHEGETPSEQCPTNAGAGIQWFMDADQVGCCTQNSYLTTASPGQFACCQCGSSCAGLPPPMLLDWSLNGATLVIGGRPQITPAPGQPAQTVTGSGNGGGGGVIVSGNAGGSGNSGGSVIGVSGGNNGPGLYTTSDQGGSRIVLPFVPTSTQTICANRPGGGNGCETLLYGPNDVATIVDSGNNGVQTTATSVLYGTFDAMQCVTAAGQTSCSRATSIFPTSTAYGVFTAQAAPRPTALGRVGGGVVVGIIGFAAAVL